MFRYLVLAFLLMLSSSYYANPIDNAVSKDQRLVFAIVVNRHGERAPDDDERSLSDQQDLIVKLTYIEGPEGLTNVGKKRAYQLGKYLRQRYGQQGLKLISNLYLRDEISIRSTDKERTKMTAQVAMAAVYPPETEQQWDEGLGKIWQPVPYTAVPLSEDYLRYYSNCKRFNALMADAKAQSLKKDFAPFQDLVPLLYEKTGQNFTENPLKFQTLFDLYRSMTGLGLEIPDWGKAIMPRLREAAKVSYRLYFKNDEMKKIGGGVLLGNFVQAANYLVSRRIVPQRLRIVSAHDFNIGSLMEVANVRSDNSIPEYGAAFALELYKSEKTGAFSVLPVYLPQAGESSAQILSIKGCGPSSHCELSKFKEITESYILKERDYYRLCDIKTEL